MISVGDIFFKVNKTDVLGMLYVQAMYQLENAATPKAVHAMPKEKSANV